MPSIVPTDRQEEATGLTDSFQGLVIRVDFFKMKIALDQFLDFLTL